MLQKARRGKSNMGYDEKFFKSSANKKAMYMWMFTAIILSVAYTVELIKGDRTPQYYITFMILCWLPFLLGVVFLLVKGIDTTWYKETVAIGYGVFYDGLHQWNRHSQPLFLKD